MGPRSLGWVLLLWGCYRSQTLPSEAPVDPPPEPAADAGMMPDASFDGGTDSGLEANDAHDAVVDPDNPFRANEYWTGDYVCPQGLTGLYLHVVAVDGDAIDATFDFDWRGTQGSFELHGTWETAERHAHFEPGAWIVRPSSSWQTVGMDGNVDHLGREFSGTIPSPGCGRFALALQ